MVKGIKSSRVHLLLLIFWILLSIVAWFIGWWSSVVFLTAVSLYTVIWQHAVGIEASKAKEEERRKK